QTWGLNGLWFDGVGAPVSSLGGPGCYYFDAQTGDLYKKFADSTITPGNQDPGQIFGADLVCWTRADAGTFQDLAGQTQAVNDAAKRVVQGDAAGGTPGQMGIYAGSTGGQAVLAPPVPFSVWIASFNGAGSVLFRDGNLFAQGNPGAQGVNGFTLGATYNQS